MKQLETIKNRYQNKPLFMLSLGYWFGAHSLGLVLHPYVSMRRIVRERVFVPLTLLPCVSLLSWWVAGFIISRLSVLDSLGLELLSGRLAGDPKTPWVLGFVFLWGCNLCLIWQVLLGYLYFRFRPLHTRI